MKKQIYLWLPPTLTTIIVSVIVFNFGYDPVIGWSSYAQKTDEVKEQIFKDAREAFERARDEEVPLFSPNNFAKANEFYQKALKDYEKGEKLKRIRKNLKLAMEYIEEAFKAARLSRNVLENLIKMSEEVKEVEVFVRNRYFKGKLLEKEDFEEEQSYLRSKIKRLSRNAAGKIEDGDVRRARSIVEGLEKEYRMWVIDVLKKIVLADARMKLKNVRSTIPKESFRETKHKFDVMENFIRAQKNKKFMIGELFTEVHTQTQETLFAAGIEVEVSELSDLVIEELTLSHEHPHMGEDIVIHAVVRNVGKEPAEEILVCFLSYERHEIDHATIDYLEPGQVEEVNITMKAEEPGEGLIIVQVDPENRIEENNEQNNEAQQSFRVEISFFEEYPEWNMPDLAVTRLTVKPERTNPGDPITLRASVSNLGTGDAKSANLVFLVDYVEIGRATIDPLGPSVETEVSVIWPAEGSSRHWVLASLEVGEGDFDRTSENNFQTAIVRVSGELYPEPELELGEIDLEVLPFFPGESYEIPLKIRNPSFAEIPNFTIDFYIDGELSLVEMTKDLAPGEEHEFWIPWTDVSPGEHMIAMKMYLPDEFTDAASQCVKAWHVIVPYLTLLCEPGLKHKWISMGPRILTNGWEPAPVGRMDCIAFHPTNPNIIYAGAPRGGVWKTTNGGDSWKPLSDKLDSLNVGALAVDQKHPDIVYFVTGSPVYKGGVGIYKTIDGGMHWHKFATKAVAEGGNNLVIRHPSPGQVLIYAGTNRGVLRYKSNNPWATTSKPSEWVQIKTGTILDMAVHPTNNSLVYASVLNGWKSVYIAPKKKIDVRIMDGLYRTTTAETASGNKDWTKLTNGLPHKEGTSLRLDIFKGNPNILYASVIQPYGFDPIETKMQLGIFRSKDGGDSWSLVRVYNPGDLHGPYNPFIRVHPTNSGLIYFGGVKLYKESVSSSAWTPQLVNGVHDDMKTLEFDPFNSSRYYILCDGGIWRCTVKGTGMTEKNLADDVPTHRNYNLRVTEFYDFDVSKIKPNLTVGGPTDLMLGGTQDNGNILYEGKLDWRCFQIYGDGYYSLIAPTNNQVMYIQYQSLDSTARSTDGGKTWKKASNGLPKGWRERDGYITGHPNSADIVISQGDQVYVTTNGGAKWTPRGPKGSNVKGHITRVVVQPKTFDWIAGTSKGQIWYSSVGGSPWYLLFEHPFYASVTRLAFAPTDHKVLYAVFNIGGSKAYTRIWRFEMNPGPPVSWSPSNITDNFPLNRTPRVICGDGHRTDIAYIGTEKGVFRWLGTKPTYESWQPYNDCLPLAIINDLLVDPKSKELRAATRGRGAWKVITGK